MWPNLNINPVTGVTRTSETEKRAIKDLLDQWKRWAERDSDGRTEGATSEEMNIPGSGSQKENWWGGASRKRRWGGKGRVKGSMEKMQPPKKVPSRKDSGRKHVGRAMMAGGFECGEGYYQGDEQG